MSRDWAWSFAATRRSGLRFLPPTIWPSLARHVQAGEEVR